MFVPETWMAVDAISACIMIVLAVASRDGSVLRERQRRVFRYALVVFLLFTAMDALVHFTGADPVVALGLAYASHVFTAVCVLSCLVYAATCVERRQGIPMVLAVMLVAFGIVDVVLLALNASFGWLFVATPGGGYEQGWAWWGQAAYLALCVMATAIYYAAARVRVNRRTSRSVLAFVAILLAGIGCQLLVAQVMVLPAFFALVALVRYADDQVEAIQLDYLTGLSNRVALDAKLSRLGGHALRLLPHQRHHRPLLGRQLLRRDRVLRRANPLFDLLPRRRRCGAPRGRRHPVVSRRGLHRLGGLRAHRPSRRARRRGMRRRARLVPRPPRGGGPGRL